MKKIASVLFLFFLSVGLGGINVNAHHHISNKGEGWKTYKKDNLSIQYPSEANLDESGLQGTTFFIYFAPPDTDKFRPNINLIVIDLKGATETLDQIGPATEQQIKTMIGNSNLLESKKTKVNGTDCWEMAYTGDLKGMLLRWKQNCYIVKGKLYILTLSSSQSAYDKFIPTGDKVLNSFKVKG